MALHYSVITNQVDIPNVKNEFNNMYIVQMIYKQTFFKYLFEKMPEIDNSIKSNCIYNFDDIFTIANLCQEINRIGLDKYKEILDEYNHAIESLQQEGKLPTPEELLTSFKNARQELRSKGISSGKEDIVFAEGLDHPVVLYGLIQDTINKPKSQTKSMSTLCTEALTTGNLSQSDIDSVTNQVIIENPEQTQGES